MAAPRNWKKWFNSESSFDELDDYYNGNHFRFWVGSRPDYNDIEVWREIERIFTSENIIGECIDRQVNTVVGKEPEILIDNKPLEDSSQMQGWLDFMHQNYQLSKNTDDSSVFHVIIKNLCIRGIAYVRLFTPLRYANSSNPLQRVFIHSPHPDNVSLKYDDDGILDSIDYYTEDTIEHQEQNPETGMLDITVYDRKNNNSVIQEFNLDLNGGWTIYKIQSTSLITPSAKQLQNNINLVLTMMGRNTIQAGFLERLLLNAQTPGNFVEDSDGELRFQPDESGFQTGASAVNYVQGLPSSGDPQQPEGYEKPEVVFRDPVSVETFERALNLLKLSLYNKFNQGHVLANVNPEMSGISREQSRHEFVLSTVQLTNKVNSALSAALTTVYKMISGRNGTVKVEFKPEPGVLDPESRKAILSEYQAGVVSHHTTLQRLNVGEPTEELEKLKGEREQDLELTQREQEIQAQNDETDTGEAQN